MDRHAYLIMAHHQFELLEMLIRLLDYDKNDIYIHIDKKVTDFDFEYFSNVAEHSKVYFTKRFSNAWGGYSIVNTELEVLKQAMQNEYSYYHLLSGVDLPLRPKEEIYKLFEDNKGKEFIHFSSNEFSHSEPIMRRFKIYHFLQEIVGRNRKGILYFLEKCSLKLQGILKINRLKKVDMDIMCGSNWVSITHDFADCVIKNEKVIRKLFRYGECVDEHYFQTIAYNSDFFNKLYFYDENGDCKSNMRYIDWERGDPYTFRTSDYEDLMASQYLFARKFDINTDREICEKIYNTLTRI